MDDPLGLAVFSFGGSASFFTGGIGGNYSVAGAVDTKSGKVCIVITTCARGGVGESMGVKVKGGVSDGSLCEGNSVKGGLFAEAGPVGGTVGTDGDSIRTSVKFGLGGGASSGAQICLSNTKCFN